MYFLTMGQNENNIPTDLSFDEVVEMAMALYRRHFHTEAKFAGVGPARVNLLGNMHTEYNNGFVLSIAMPLVTVIVGRPNEIDNIHVVTEECVSREESIHAIFHIPVKEKLVPGKPIWANGIKGVVKYFPHDVLGFNCAVVTTIPVGGGLGSSAALQSATCSFLEAITNVKLDVETKINVCIKAEQMFTTLISSSVDAIVSVKGSLNKAYVVDCRSWEVEAIDLNSPTTKFLVVDSKVRRTSATDEVFLRRKNECKMVAQYLNLESLRDGNTKQIEKLLKERVITEDVHNRAWHILREGLRLYEGVHAAMKMDLDALGFLMTQSHLSLKKNYEITCHEIDQLVDIIINVEGVLGCRMTGSGLGGCVVALVKKDCVSSVIAEVKANVTDYEPDFYVINPSAGARIINLNKFKNPTGSSLFP